MFKIFKNLLRRNSPCRTLQKIECEKFLISGKCLEIGNTEFNKKSFFNDFHLKNVKLNFCDLKKVKKKDYFIVNLEKKNFVKKKFENILIFNVLEHVYETNNAISEIKKLLKSDGKIYISTPFLYRYHHAPRDYYRFTLDFYSRFASKHKLKIIYMKNLGTGPFFSSYSMIHNILTYVFPLNIIFAAIMLIMDKIIFFFSKNLKNIYPICNFVVLKKK